MLINETYPVRHFKMKPHLKLAYNRYTNILPVANVVIGDLEKHEIVNTRNSIRN